MRLQDKPCRSFVDIGIALRDVPCDRTHHRVHHHFNFTPLGNVLATTAVLFQTRDQMIVAGILHPDSDKACIRRNKAALSGIVVDIVGANHKKEKVVRRFPFREVPVLGQDQMGATDKSEISDRTTRRRNGNQAVLGNRAFLKPANVAIKFNLANQFGGTENQQLLGAHEAICRRTGIFMKVMGRDILIVEQLQVMTKTNKRRRICQGATVTAIGLGDKVSPKIPQERRHLLVTSPVVLDSELERNHQASGPILHLGFGNGAQHAKELWISLNFAIVQSEFQPDAFIGKEPANIQEPRNRIDNGVATDMRSLHHFGVETARIDSIQHFRQRGNQARLGKIRHPGGPQL